MSEQTSETLDRDRFGAWCDERGLGTAGAPIELTEVSGGIQNVIYEVRRDGLHAALRIPPPKAPDARDEGIKREWRIIEALDGTELARTVPQRPDEATRTGVPTRRGRCADGGRRLGGARPGRSRSTRRIPRPSGRALVALLRSGQDP